MRVLWFYRPRHCLTETLFLPNVTSFCLMIHSMDFRTESFTFSLSLCPMLYCSTQLLFVNHKRLLVEYDISRIQPNASPERRLNRHLLSTLLTSSSLSLGRLLLQPQTLQVLLLIIMRRNLNQP